MGDSVNASRIMDAPERYNRVVRRLTLPTGNRKQNKTQHNKTKQNKKQTKTDKSKDKNKTKQNNM